MQESKSSSKMKKVESHYFWVPTSFKLHKSVFS